VTWVSQLYLKLFQIFKMKQNSLKVFSGFLLQEIGKLDQKFYDFPVTLVCSDGEVVASSFFLAAISPFMKQILDEQSAEFLINLTEFDVLVVEIKTFFNVVTESKQLENTFRNTFIDVCKLFNVEEKITRKDFGSAASINIAMPEVEINNLAMEDIDLYQNGIIFSCSHCYFTSSTIDDVSDHMELSHASATNNITVPKSEDIQPELNVNIPENQEAKSVEKCETENNPVSSVNKIETNVISAPELPTKTLGEELHLSTTKYVYLESQDKEVKERVEEEYPNSKVELRNEYLSVEKEIDSIKCEVCKNIFSSIYTLKRHMATHNKQRPFKCKLCNKSFTQKVVLKEHILLHTGEKRFVCNVCDKSFQQNNHLKYHMLSAHNIGKRHVCEDCGKVYTFRHQLTSHISKMHGGLADNCFTCPDCPDRVFMTKTKYNMHMETFHPKKNVHSKLFQFNKL